MLIADLNTLETIYSLYFTDHIILNCTYTLNSQDIMRIYATFCKFITCFKDLSVCDLDTGSVWNKVSLGFTCFLICNDNFTFLLSVIDNSNTRNLCDDGKTFRLSCLKKLLDTRKTLCDISTGNTTGMESTHGQLCTWLTDRLCCNDTNRLTNLYRLTGSHVRTITFCADTNLALTGKDGTDLQFVDRSACLVAYALFHDTGCTLRCDHVVCFNKDFSVFILNCLTGETSCDTLLKTLDLFFSVHESTNDHTGDLCSVLTAVRLTNDQILRYVNKSSCQVSGIGCEYFMSAP